MSTLHGAIREEEQEYLDLCRRYQESPRYRTTRWARVADAYGEHARALRARAKQEQTNEQHGHE